MPPMKIPDWEGKYFFIYAVSGMLITVDDPIRVLEVWSGDKILEIESQSEPASMIGASSSSMSSGSAHVGRKQSECITPFPKRKEEDADLPDISSTSKKLCTAIKVEKEKEE
ncbi:hypothetical protein F2Q69_00002536 [Brassica cretica]|uniref:Uncharacterized protein n=1 Tax=Brassica cretica TaxID=69181 RepID=A0A8S9P1E6_BRACR|nr:hypothetical protein F2Q69_00002536 [Brassica cretica]